MSAIRKFGWSALVLAAFAGCAKEEPVPATTPPTETKPEATSATPAPGTEPTPSGEMKGPSAAPAGGMPKIEAPQPTPAPKEETLRPRRRGSRLTRRRRCRRKSSPRSRSFPQSDANQALKQLLCPVSGENLGSMGVPLKVTAAGQTFFLCCKGCNKDVQDDPAAVVAKLKK